MTKCTILVIRNLIMKKNHLNTILLGIVTISAILTSLKWMIPIFAWIMPIALLAYVRRNSKWKSLFFGIISVGIGSGIAGYKVIPFPPYIFPVVMLVAAFITLIPCLVDKWLVNNKWRGFLSTLVFPVTAVTIEYLMSLDPNQGTWGSIAITQYGNLPLMQLVSVTGIWGICFLIYWTASVINWIIENLETKNHTKAFFGFKIYASVVFIILLFGSISLIPSFANTEKQVRIAAITAPTTEMEEVIKTAYKAETNNELLNFSIRDIVPGTPRTSEVFSGLDAFFKNAKDQKFDPVHEELKQYHNVLFALSQREVDGGAKIVVWSEAAGMIFLEEKDEFIQRGQEFALNNQVYLVLGISIQIPDSEKGDNLAITISPDGEILNSYGKSIPVPGEASLAGDGNIPIFETEYGNIAVAICFDADHPDLIRQVGLKGADILLLPSADWHAIVPYHSYMSVFRAIENGVSLVRPVSNGQTLAVDSRGRVLFSTQETATSGWVPVNKTKTIYLYINNMFAWMSILGLLVIIIVRKVFTTNK